MQKDEEVALNRSQNPKVSLDGVRTAGVKTCLVDLTPQGKAHEDMRVPCEQAQEKNVAVSQQQRPRLSLILHLIKVWQ